MAHFEAEQEAAAGELVALFKEQGYGAGLRELQLRGSPKWLPEDKVDGILRHAPQLEAFECEVDGHRYSYYGFDATALPPSIRRVTLRLNPNGYLPEGCPDVPTIEVHCGHFLGTKGMPTPSPILQHARICGSYKPEEELSGEHWPASNLRMLAIHMGHNDF
jgi:hypothetical protein